MVPYFTTFSPEQLKWFLKKETCFKRGMIWAENYINTGF